MPFQMHLNNHEQFWTNCERIKCEYFHEKWKWHTSQWATFNRIVFLIANMFAKEAESRCGLIFKFVDFRKITFWVKILNLFRLIISLITEACFLCGRLFMELRGLHGSVVLLVDSVRPKYWLYVPIKTLVSNHLQDILMESSYHSIISKNKWQLFSCDCTIFNISMSINKIYLNT